VHESTETGARREAREASASIDIEALLAVYNIPRLSQAQLIYLARLVSPEVAPVFALRSNPPGETGTYL
jgi:hypothetical protein